MASYILTKAMPFFDQEQVVRLLVVCRRWIRVRERQTTRS